MSSGVYGDAVPLLAKAWSAHVAENMKPKRCSTSSSASTNFKNVMRSVLPCTMKIKKKSIFGGVSQLSQVCKA